MILHAVVVIHAIDSFKNHRCVGIYTDSNVAYEDVTTNAMFIRDDEYDYALIESFDSDVPYGGIITPDNQKWFKWELDRFVQIDIPERFFNIAGWAF